MSMTMIIATGLLAAASALGAPTMPGPPEKPLETGSWGGEHVRLTVTARGATVEYDCGLGRIDQPISSDANGRFVVMGWHVHEHGGAVRADVADQKRTARYIGRVSNDQMTLTVELTESDTKLGTFSLERDKAVRLVKCR